MLLQALSEFFSAVTTFAVGAAMTLPYFFRPSDVIKNQETKSREVLYPKTSSLKAVYNQLQKDFDQTENKG